MPSLDLEVRTQLDRVLANAAAAEAIRIFSRAGDEIGGGLGSKVSHALGTLNLNPAKAALRELQGEYAKLSAAADAASSLVERRAAEVEVAMRRKVAVAADDTATAVESARAERALVDTRKAHEQALRRNETAIIAAEGAHQRLGSAAVAAGESAGVASRAFNLLGAGAVVATGAAMFDTTKHAADFQQRLERLSAVTGDTAQNVKIVHDGILQLSGQVGYSSGELADGMLLVEKANYRGADGLKVLAAASQLASMENADLKETINAVTTSMSDFHIPVDQATTITSKLKVAVGDSKVSIQEFSGSLHSVEPVAQMFGVSLDQTYASLARMTQSGMSADQATQNLAQAIRNFGGPSGTMRDALGKIGLSASGLQAQLGDPKVGIVGVLSEVSSAIRDRVGPDGKVAIDTLYKNADATNALNTAYSALSPASRAMADGLNNGSVQMKELRQQAVIDPQLKQWMTMRTTVDGLSSNLKKLQPNLETVQQLWKEATGGAETLNVAALLAGSPEALKNTNDEISKLGGTMADANGKTQGYTQSQDTYNAKMKDARAAFEATRIEVGEAFLPVMTRMLDVTKDVGQVLATHPGILHGVVDGVEGMAGAWAIFKAANIAETVLSPIARGIGTIIDEEAGAEAATGRLRSALGGLAKGGALALGAQLGGQAAQDAAGPTGFWHDMAVLGTDAGTGAGIGAAVASVVPGVGTILGGGIGAGVGIGTGLWNMLSRAEGGPLSGPGPAGRDSALFWGADGEHVWTHNEVQAAGGHGAMYAMRNAVLRREFGGAIGPDVQAAMSMVGQPYSQSARNDCSGMVGRVVEAATGMGGGLPTTQNMGQWLVARGFVPGIGPAGTMSVGWYNHGSAPNDGHAAMTLSNGMNAESGGSHGNFMIGGGAAGAASSQFDHHMYLPQLYGEGPAGMGGFGGGFGGGAGGFGGMGGFGGGGVPAGSTAGIGPGGQSGYYSPNPQGVERAQGRIRDLDNQIHDLEERKSELKATASQSERDRLDHELEHAHRERDEAQGKLAEAQQGTFHAGRGGGGGGSMLATGLPENFGLGKGLPGIAEWLVDWIGDMAMAPWAASLAMGGMGGSDGAALPSIGGGFGGGMPMPGVTDVAAWMPNGSTTGADAGSASGVPGPASSGGAATPGAAPTSPSSQIADYKNWYPRSDSPATPAGAPAGGPGIRTQNDYRLWQAGVLDVNGNPIPHGPVSGLIGDALTGGGRGMFPTAPVTGSSAYIPGMLLPGSDFGPGLLGGPGASPGTPMRPFTAPSQPGAVGPASGPPMTLLPPLYGDAIHRATGGAAFPGGPRGTDTVPAWLTPGEEVEQTSAVAKYGKSTFEAMNMGLIDPASIRYYAGGFEVGDAGEAATTAATAPITGAPPRPAAAIPSPTPAQGEKPTNAQPGESVSMPFNQGQSSPGLGISGGAGGQAAGMFPGGSLAFALAGRTIGYAGQAAAIGTEALMQTFLPNDSPLANFSNTVPGKLLGAVAGARPAGQNMAGKQTPQLTRDQVDAKDAKSGSTQGGAPFIGEQHNYGVNNGDDVAAALTRATLSSSAAGRNR